MPVQPVSYYQRLVPNDDIGPNQWAATGPNHWAEIDESYLAPDTADDIHRGGAIMSGQVERFGLTNPNNNNLEGGFDRLDFYIYAYKGGTSADITLNLDLHVKGAWQGSQAVIVNGVGVANVAWYHVHFSKFNCCYLDAPDLQLEIEINPGSYDPSDGVVVTTVYLGITGQDILHPQKAVLSSQLI